MGSEMLSVDADGSIDASDFEAAKLRIVQDVRRNKLEQALKEAGSGRYQDILGAMAKYPTPNVPLTHISEVIGLDQPQYSASMGKLIERNVISRTDRGVYTFVEPLLKEYIRAFGTNTPDEGGS